MPRLRYSPLGAVASPPSSGAQIPIPGAAVSPHGAYAYVRRTAAEGACGSKPHPCVHPGVDLLGKRGTRVVAPEDGTIIRTANGSSSPFTGYGPWLVVFQGRSGLYHLLAHLDPATAAMGTPGVPVRAGAVLGTTSSANHVHWEVRRSPTPASGVTNLENGIDPFVWLARERGSPGPGWFLVAAVAAILIIRG